MIELDETDNELIEELTKNPKEMMRDIIFKKLERDDSHNIFTNLNNFSRDEFIVNETVNVFWEFYKEIVEERIFLQKSRNHFSNLYFSKGNKDD